MTKALNEQAVGGKAVDARAREARLPQIPALTGLRFFAAAFILVEHAADWLVQFTDSDVKRYFVFLGIYGMPLFFVLSGFVIHYNYRRLFLSRSIARATCEFAAARFARLYPLYASLLLVAVCANNLLAQSRGDLTLIAKIMGYYITLTQSWWYVVYDNKVLINWLFGLSWSISTEMFFYAAFVAVVFLILSIRRARTAALVAVVYGIAIWCLFLMVPHFNTSISTFGERYIPNYIGPQQFNDSFYRWLFYFSPYVRVFEFVMGCLGAHVFVLIRQRPIGLFERRLADVGLALVAVFLAGIGLLYLGIVRLGEVNGYVGFFALNFLCAPSLAFIMFHVSRYDSRFARMLSVPAIIVLGDASYSIYLLHEWTFSIFFRQPVQLYLVWAIDTVLRVTGAIGLTLVTAYATYHLIEVPSRAWLRRRLGALIGAAFGDRVKAADAGRASTREIKPDPWKWRFGTPGRLAFSVASIFLLAAVGIVGQAAQSPAAWRDLDYILDGFYGPEIKIITATYGINCSNYPEHAPYTNTAVAGNAAAGMRRSCDGRMRCTLPVDLQIAGDPANGCGKDFSVAYRCTGAHGTSSPVKWVYLPAEAFGKALHLACERWPRSAK